MKYAESIKKEIRNKTSPIPSQQNKVPALSMHLDTVLDTIFSPFLRVKAVRWVGPLKGFVDSRQESQQSVLQCQDADFFTRLTNKMTTLSEPQLCGAPSVHNTDVSMLGVTGTWSVSGQSPQQCV